VPAAPEAAAEAIVSATAPAAAAAQGSAPVMAMGAVALVVGVAAVAAAEAVKPKNTGGTAAQADLKDAGGPSPAAAGAAFGSHVDGGSLFADAMVTGGMGQMRATAAATKKLFNPADSRVQKPQVAATALARATPAAAPAVPVAATAAAAAATAAAVPAPAEAATSSERAAAPAAFAAASPAHAEAPKAPAVEGPSTDGAMAQTTL